MFTAPSEIKPYQERTIDRGSVAISVRESGTPDGYPVLILADGPGLAFFSPVRGIFTWDDLRVIDYDYRGTGSSRFSGEPSHSLDDYVDDALAIVENLQVERLAVVGLGFGARLALSLIAQLGSRVESLILQAPNFYGPTEKALRWQGGVKHWYPEAWQNFAQGDEQPLARIFATFARGNELTSMSAARAWAAWDATSASLETSNRTIEHYLAGGGARHYSVIMQAFLQQQLCDPEQFDFPSISCPMLMVHGRFDMHSPLSTSLLLQQHYPEAELHIVRLAGHSALDPAMHDGLYKASKWLLQSLDLEPIG